VYELDNEGFCISDGVIVPPGLVAQAREGAACCPERAITLSDDDAS
jgi:ferredoxin